MLTIEPLFGLCNRMRALDSAILLSRKIDLPIRLIWNKTRDLNCSFTELFELPEFVTLYHSHPASDLFNKYLPRIGVNLLSNYEKCIYRWHLDSLTASKYDFDQLKKYSSVYIRTCNRFYYGGPLFAHFKPVPRLRATIDRICSAFTPHTIGIHVRRTDNYHSIKYSPTRAFEVMMNEILERNGQTNFFLATDSPQEERRMKRIFGTRIVTFEKELNRNTAQGIQDAVVDLYCLSRTSRIIGSTFSSFSETASEISTIERFIIDTQKPVQA